MSTDEYWEQIIHACYLDDDEPIKRWRETAREQDRGQARPRPARDRAPPRRGRRRRPLGHARDRPPLARWPGRNIPSFEIFTTPDWRGTEGTVRFSEPLYRYGSLIQDVRLRFERGEVVEASAAQNEDLLVKR